MLSRARVLPAIATFGAVAAAALIVSSPIDLAVWLITAVVFIGPGWPLSRWMLGAQADGLTRLIVAPALGYLVGALVYSLLRLIGVSAPVVVLSACGLVTAGLSVVRLPEDGVVETAPLGPADRTGVAVLTLIALAITAPVFANVGRDTPLGLAYRAYFNADLFVHMGVVAELAKGTSPPMNPYFPAEPLPYYWAYFTLPAVFSQLRPELLVDRGIMLTDTATAIVFVSTGYVLLRNLGASALASALAWLTIVLASSFEGAYFLWSQYSRGRPLAELEVTNIDGLTRWMWNAPSLDGFQRAMWWTPQHESALVMFLLVIWTMARARTRDGMRTGVLEGLLLAGALMLSSFNGLLMTACYGLTQVVFALRGPWKNLGRWIAARAVAATLVGGAFGMLIALGIVQFVEGSFIFGWNPYFLRAPWGFMLLNFGPALFLAPFGLAAVARASRRVLVALTVLVLVSLVVFLFVELRGHENTQVSFRTGQLVWMALAVCVAFAVDAARQAGRWAATAFFAVWTLGVVVAAPTVAIDWYNARDITNVAMNPGGFPWTVHVTREEQSAMRWARRGLPLDATLQPDALPRARYTWAMVPAFFERRMATGNNIAQLNPGKVGQQLDAIHRAFGQLDADQAHAFFRSHGVDYLYVGELERRVHGAAVQKFFDRSDRFRRVFGQGSVSIFQVLP